jgi:hypothetical protein
MQASAFARIAGDETTLSWVRNQFKTVYLSQMMDQDGQSRSTDKVVVN